MPMFVYLSIIDGNNDNYFRFSELKFYKIVHANLVKLQ